MLHSISWSIFILSFLCLAGAFWLIIVIFYYPKELKNLLNRKGRLKASMAQPRPELVSVSKPPTSGGAPVIPLPGASKKSSPPANAQETDSLFGTAYKLIDEIKEAITNAVSKKSPREELIFALQILLTKDSYTGLRHTPMKVAVNNFIESECFNQGAYGFSAEELEILWTR